MQLSFSHPATYRLCCREQTLAALAKRNAGQLRRLLNEIACAETLTVLDTLPHLELVVERERVAVCCEPIEVLLSVDGAIPSKGRSTAAKVAEGLWSAKAARVVAVAIDGEDFNPEGAKWPQ
jgi:hypothetical protein